MKFPTLTSNDLRVFAVLLVVAMTSFAAEAQTELLIELDKSLCERVDSVSVVYNQSDTAWPAEKLPQCKWKRTITGSINPKITFFSLRLGNVGRTPCRRATSANGNLRVGFRHPGDGPAYEMKIEGPVFNYVRQVTAIDKDDVPCEEEDTTRSTLYGVQFASEDVRVQLFEQRRVACGVILDDLAPLKKIDGSGGDVDIQPKHLADAVVAQGLKTKLCIPPTFLTAEVIEADLRQKNRSFKIKVKP